MSQLNYFFVNIKMNYYWLLEKAKDKHENKGGKEKAAKYYKKKQETNIKISEEEKESKR